MDTGTTLGQYEVNDGGQCATSPVVTSAEADSRCHHGRISTLNQRPACRERAVDGSVAKLTAATSATTVEPRRG